MDNKLPIAAFYEENSGLIHAVARHGYTRLVALNANLDYEDLVQDLTEIFIKSYALHDPIKSKFSTYFTNAAYNRLNAIARRAEQTCRPQTISSTQLSVEFGEYDFFESLDDERASPEHEVLAQESFKSAIAKLSPFAKLLVEYTLTPPEFIVKEFKAQIAYAEMSRSRGIDIRGKHSLDLFFVVSFFKRFGVAVADKYEVRCLDKAVKEINAVIREAMQ